MRQTITFKLGGQPNWTAKLKAGDMLLVGAVEYADCTSDAGLDPHSNKCLGYDTWCWGYCSGTLGNVKHPFV